MKDKDLESALRLLGAFCGLLANTKPPTFNYYVGCLRFCTVALEELCKHTHTHTHENKKKQRRETEEGKKENQLWSKVDLAS